ncbi:MAG TPA: hypothetical protein VK787_06890 [Puia sp.]|nr:hypothetical protein [Puia sp.]
MQKNNMYFDTNRTKIYKDIYRPSSNFFTFFRSILSVILSGHPVAGNPSYYRIKKSK